MIGPVAMARRPLLKCWVQQGRSAAIVRARGEVDISSAEILRRCIERAFRRGEPVVVDLSEVTYLDGSGFRILEAMTAQAAGQARKFWVVPGPRVRRLLSLLRLRTIPVVETLEDALGRTAHQ